jgi:hypothetical protein
MKKNYLAPGVRRADDVLGFEGYLFSGGQIVPIRKGDEIPTVVGYYFFQDNRIVLRNSSIPEEASQIVEFRERIRESSLTLKIE